METDFESLEKMLQNLTRLNITDPKTILMAIEESDLPTLTRYVSLVEKGIVTSALFHQHNGLFNPKTKEYEDFTNNINLLLERRMPLNYLSGNQETFITPHHLLSQNLATLDQYNFTKSLQSGINCSFLNMSDLTLAIDTLLELGYEDNLEESLELLNYKDRFPRLQVIKHLNVAPTTTEELLTVLTTNKFFLPDSRVEDYIYNAVDYNLPSEVVTTDEQQLTTDDLEVLSEFENTSRTYSFDGVLISKNKAIRNLDTLHKDADSSERLLYGLIKGSVLSDEEYATIKTRISSKKSWQKIK